MDSDSPFSPFSLNNGDDFPEKSEHKHALTKERTFSRLSVLENLLRIFSPSERLLLYVFSIVLCLSFVALVSELNASISTTVPSQGGVLQEGQVGPARFINPLLTMSQPDQDLTALVYSGLMRAGADGSLIPDLASSYSVSEDGTEYIFSLRPNLKFHDGSPLSSADVVFTVQAAQNPEIKSVHRADWEGVEVSAPDEHTIVFKLSRAYAPFIFNTTMGILPKSHWEHITTEEFPFSPLNTRPIGSGPYKVSNVITDDTGSALRYDLAPAANFPLEGPHLKRLSFIFYPNESEMIKAFNAKKISAIAGVSPGSLSSLTRDDASITTATLPRVFGIFFNQNHAAVLSEPAVRAALDAAVDKQSLVDEVLQGYGVPLQGPIPPGVLGQASRIASSSLSTTQQNASSTNFADHARAILSRGGWTFSEEKGWTKKNQTLSFVLATADEPELVETAQAVAQYWHEAGIDVEIQVFQLSELNTSVIRPRNYDAILFGEVVGREGDLFAFWHSSQRNDPGLNLAMYANSRADSLLAQARATTDKKTRENLYMQFAALVQKDSAAIFLFAPEFIYVVPSSIQGIQLGALTTPAERFLNVYQWYTDTERVWDIFVTK